MSTEIDLVREFMKSTDVSADDLRAARSALDGAIVLEAGRVLDLAQRTPSQQPRRRRRLLRWGIGVPVAAAVVAIAVVVVVPSGRTTAPPAAAAEIARLADAAPAVPPLAPGQWYQYQLQGELTANVSSGTTTAPITATATIPIAVGAWANSTDAVCTSEQFGTASFGTPTDARAWQAMGLVATPANQPATGCSAGVEASWGVGGTRLRPIDVSNITHDPATLATELQDATTGIGAIDHYAAGKQSQVLGFRRLTSLLVGPLKGQWSGFGQEMLKTMALLPGIVSLGTMTSHSGAHGLAFSMPGQVTLNPNDGAKVSSFTPPTVILDPQNGNLLEVRHLDYSVLQSAAQDFVGGPSALVYSQGVSYGTTAEWIDPVSGLQVIGQGSLPAWISTIHIIEAVTAPSTTSSQLAHLLNPFLGNGTSDSEVQNTPVNGENTDDITTAGTLAAAESMANTLTASGLFVSVSVKL